MGWYEAFRDKPAASQYGEIHTAVSVDVFDAGLIFAFSVIAFSFLLLLPGYMGKERYSMAIRVFLSIFIGLAILLSNYGMEWERSEVTTDTQYKAFMSQEIKAEVGVKIGLRGVNVTLKGHPVKQSFDNSKAEEHIDYNEKFRWDSPWSQGRLGFGKYASQINNEYHSALQNGFPYPILLIAEYFTMDGENIRWGRVYRLAGFYTQVSLWVAFTFWVITNIMFLMVIRYGAYFLSITGVSILLGDLIYDTLHWGAKLLIPFPAGALDLKYGWCFWLSLATGFICLFLGVLIVILEYFFPGPVATFFNVDIVTEFEDVVVEEHEMEAAGVYVDTYDSGDATSSAEDEAAETDESGKKRIHFVSKSRYAGISNWHPTKSPLAKTKSSPVTDKEMIGPHGEGTSNGDVRRSSSVKINIIQAFDNEAFIDNNAETENLEEEKNDINKERSLGEEAEGSAETETEPTSEAIEKKEEDNITTNM